MPNSNKLPTDTKPLTVLHTSDWHLGRRLYGNMRYDEFEAFLAWLTQTIQDYKVDVLIVAGDIFDTMTPSNRAQSLYYRFLGEISQLYCDHVVIVAGNHDSPSFLDAPAEILKYLSVHVIGTACENLKDEVLLLKDKQGEPQCLIAAVPYLRDRDVRLSLPGESTLDKDKMVLAGIQHHYDQVAQIAKTQQAALSDQYQRHIPIIATGHLFAAGSKTTEDDGVRDLYVGSLGQVSAELFDEAFDYVALGHLHVPQKVGNREHIRYCGSPIAMGFGEARQQKQVLLLQFGTSIESLDFATTTDESVTATNQASLSNTRSANVSTATQPIKPSSQINKLAEAQQADLFGDLFGDTEEAESAQDSLFSSLNSSLESGSEHAVNSLNDTPIFSENGTESSHKVLFNDSDKAMQLLSIAVPCFQRLMQVKGDLPHIQQTIATLPKDESIWLEVIYDGDEIVTDLRDQINALIEDTQIEVLKTKNNRTYDRILQSENSNETLQDLDELEVFQRCLDINQIAESQRPKLINAYSEILYNIKHDDKMAE